VKPAIILKPSYHDLFPFKKHLQSSEVFEVSLLKEFPKKEENKTTFEWFRKSRKCLRLSNTSKIKLTAKLRILYKYRDSPKEKQVLKSLKSLDSVTMTPKRLLFTLLFNCFCFTNTRTHLFLLYNMANALALSLIWRHVKRSSNLWATSYFLWPFKGNLCNDTFAGNKQFVFQYSGAPLIRSPMGRKHLAVTTRWPY